METLCITYVFYLKIVRLFLQFIILLKIQQKLASASVQVPTMGIPYYGFVSLYAMILHMAKTQQEIV